MKPKNEAKELSVKQPLKQKIVVKRKTLWRKINNVDFEGEFEIIEQYATAAEVHSRKCKLFAIFHHDYFH